MGDKDKEHTYEFTVKYSDYDGDPVSEPVDETGNLVIQFIVKVVNRQDKCKWFTIQKSNPPTTTMEAFLFQTVSLSVNWPVEQGVAEIGCVLVISHTNTDPEVTVTIDNAAESITVDWTPTVLTSVAKIPISS